MITGNMKILYVNYLVSQSQTLTVTSGNGDYMYDLDMDTEWISLGSDDLTTETITTTFDQPQTIDRMFLNTNNFAKFDIQYWDGDSWEDFTNVLCNWDGGNTISDYSGSYLVDAYGNTLADAENIYLNKIEFDNNTVPEFYMEFDAVSVEKVRIRVTETFVANEEKTLTEWYIGREIGTFVEDPFGYPNKYEFTPNGYNATILTKSNNGSIRYERGNKYSARFSFKELWEQNDVEIIYEMFDLGEFVVYPCGAEEDYPYQRGLRMQDFYHCTIVGDLDSSFAVGRAPNMGLDIKFEVRAL